MVETPLRGRVLGGVLKRIGGFSVNSFDQRLILQKKVYLLQAFGVYLGYRFSWYLRGPYSPDLTQDAYAIKSVYQELPDYHFPREEYEESLQRFVQFVSARQDDAEWLELVASLHFLRKVHPLLDKEAVIDRVKAKQEYFTTEKCEQAWTWLEAAELV